jgi:glutathione S-transferase
MFANHSGNESRMLTHSTIPILYSYRRCPYAMRARMALKVADISVEIREISLREKPASLLRFSPKGTVPVLVLQNGEVLEQSLDIMHWALTQRDINGWLEVDLAVAQSLIDENDGAFKYALDRYKYPERYPEQSQEFYRKQGEKFLQKLELQLAQQTYLLKNSLSLADIAIFPFVRQFAAVDDAWFSQSDYPHLRHWLAGLVNSDLFESIMQKQPTFVDCS